MKKIFFIFAFCAVFTAVSSMAFAQEDGEEGFFFSKGDFKGQFYGNIYADFYYQWTSASGGSKAQNSMLYPIIGPSSTIGMAFSYKDKFEAKLEIAANFESLYDALFFMNARYNFDNGGYISLGKDGDLLGYLLDQVSDDENGLANWGALDDGELIMLKYGIEGFEVALVDTYFDPGREHIEAVASSPGNTGKLQYLPRLETAYTFSNDIAEFRLAAGYAYYLARSDQGGNEDYGIHSTTVNAGTTINIGEAVVKLTAFYGFNTAMTGNISDDLLPDVSRTADGSIEVQNVQTFGVAAGFGYAVSDMVTPQIGVGYTGSFGSQFKHYNGKCGMYQNVGVYANMAIKISEWFTLYPEFVYLNNLDNGSGNAGETNILAGVHTLFSF